MGNVINILLWIGIPFFGITAGYILGRVVCYIYEK